MKTLITGIAGFAGSQLAELLLSEGHEVSGIDIAGVGTDNLARIEARISHFPLPATSLEKTAEIVGKVRPDWIFHLAGMSNVAQSWSGRAQTLHANLFGAFHLLEAVRLTGLKPSILAAGSGEQYGLVSPKLQPIPETSPQWPRSPYATSKVCQEMLCLQYIATDGFDIKLIRPFNHIGPRQKPSFVTADFARQIARIEQGLAPNVIRVGNLKASRDFTDVRDMVRGYYLAIQTCPSAEPFNISSGRGYSIQQLLDKLLALSTGPISVQIDAERLRPADIPQLVGDNTKFRRLTGWSPDIGIDQTLAEIMAHWRQAAND